jgi:hypothetical protein
MSATDQDKRDDEVLPGERICATKRWAFLVPLARHWQHLGWKVEIDVCANGARTLTKSSLCRVQETEFRILFTVIVAIARCCSSKLPMCRSTSPEAATTRSAYSVKIQSHCPLQRPVANHRQLHDTAIPPATNESRTNARLREEDDEGGEPGRKLLLCDAMLRG